MLTITCTLPLILKHHRENRPTGKNTVHKTYEDMVVQAVWDLQDKNGSSIPSIRKYVLDKYDKAREAALASFNNMTMKALKKAVDTGKLDRTKSSYRISAAEKVRILQREKERKMGVYIANAPGGGKGSGKGSRRSFNERYGPIPKNLDEDDIFTGTAAEHNKVLRTLLMESRSNRDTFLTDRMHLIKPFLTDKNYFTRK